ncbi:MAG: hypothetical protein L0J45_05355 [Psychroflexus sp.]|nr:hypothetical protein [Psychroflexus sp.]MDN6310667.1 hypothetical protein [Psychroflexus sp.]
MRKQIKFRKQRDLGAIITDTFSFYRNHAKSFFTVFLKHVGPLILLTTAVSAYVQRSAGSLMTFDDASSQSDVDFFSSTFGKALTELSALSFLSVIASFVTYAALITCVLYCVKSVLDDGEIIEANVVKNMRSRFFSFMGALLLVTVVSLVGSLFLLIPGIYLFVTLSLIFAIMVFKNQPMIEAFNSCFSLIKSNWWITFLTLIIIGLLVSFISGVFQLPMIVLGLIEGFTSASQSGSLSLDYMGSWLYITFYVVATIASYVLMTISVISSTLIYFNLDEFHNSTGQLEEIEKIGEENL